MTLDCSDICRIDLLIQQQLISSCSADIIFVMITSALFASLHYLGLAIGLGSIFVRGILLKKLSRDPKSVALENLFMADNFWGLAAVTLIGTGLMRAFGGMEKGKDWYLHNHIFYLKMTLFLLVFLIELRPMITLIQWRVRRKKNPTYLPTVEQFAILARLNRLELLFFLLIPFAASLMARGLNFPA